MEHTFSFHAGALEPLDGGSHKKIMVAVPAFYGTINVPTADLLMNTMLNCIEKGWGFQRVWRAADPDLARLRDVIATVDFLESDCTDLVFLDADVGADPHAVTKICTPDVDLVAGCVPYRQDPLGFPIRWLPGDLFADPNTRLLEVEGIGMALTRITRQAVTKMVDAYPALRFRCKSSKSGFATGLFYPELETDGDRWSEDLSFCRRWRAIGGKVWMDPEIGTSHTGLKTFEGHIGDWLRRKMMEEAEARSARRPIPADRLDAAIAQFPELAVLLANVPAA